jgi:hypothetical protein
MTADQHLTWTGDPTILVYAVRGILGHTGSHAPTLIADTILGNRRQLTDAARHAIVRDVSGWLDGPGATATAVDREPWLTVLRGFGIDRPIETLAELAAVLPPPRRRRAS